MSAGLLIAGLLVTAMVAGGLWLMARADVEPAARSTGQAPDATEETEVRDHNPRRSSILVDGGPEIDQRVKR